MKRIFIDQEKCDGCKNCSFACMQAHRQTPGTVYDLDLLDPKNEARHSIVTNGKGGYVPVFCRHCAVPDCAGACMSGALKKDPETGHIQYDEKRCGTCFMCVMSCPYGNIKPDRVSRTKILKCDFCVNDKEEPNCVKSCPKKAIHVEEVVWEAAV
ncbi:MAG: 4Fe-4S dicluster domain-containing protein [Spirochaetales bacterium]|jgi:carbon-monoxide dehydrogenase iron sulfur subunit|nr:4Fe-4S dicluster domain-containing protein [Spirochaetales bacterium]